MQKEPYLDADNKLVRTDAWREQDYIDLWSLPHFLSGMLVGFALFYAGTSPITSFITAFMLLTAFEMWEAWMEIEETLTNRVMDVIIGMASFTPVFFLATSFPQWEVLSVFAVTGVADGILSFLGWRASIRATAFEAKLRAAKGLPPR